MERKKMMNQNTTEIELNGTTLNNKYMKSNKTSSIINNNITVFNNKTNITTVNTSKINNLS